MADILSSQEIAQMLTTSLAAVLRSNSPNKYPNKLHSCYVGYICERKKVSIFISVPEVRISTSKRYKQQIVQDASLPNTRRGPASCAKLQIQHLTPIKSIQLGGLLLLRVSDDHLVLFCNLEALKRGHGSGGLLLVSILHESDPGLRLDHPNLLEARVLAEEHLQHHGGRLVWQVLDKEDVVWYNDLWHHDPLSSSYR